MILGFKPQFTEPIIIGTKIHSIREDKGNRWNEKPYWIQCATGVRTKKLHVFAIRDYKGFQTIEFKWFPGNISEWGVQVKIDDVIVTNHNGIIDALVKNDGFASRKDFFEWPGWYRKNFKGKIIHWTDFRYDV